MVDYPVSMRQLKSNLRRNRFARSVLSRKLTLLATLFIVFYISMLFGGGASRPDVASLLYLRPICVTLIVACCIKSEILDLRQIKTALIFLGIFAGIMAIQILPLPFAYWQIMPGHEDLYDTQLVPTNWRPISISPDRTLNSLVSLTVPLAALIATLYFSRSKKAMIGVIIIGGITSGAFAIAQIALGEDSVFYLYRITTNGAVGLFSNPNHQAVMLSCLIPMIAIWLTDSASSNLKRDLAAISLVCLILILIMVTGSRSGLAAALIGLLSAFALHDACSPRMRTATRRRYRIFYFSSFLVAGAIAALTIALGRNLAMARLSQLDVASDLRFANFQIFIELAKQYFPFGSGAGTFDPAFRIIEPASAVKQTYVNHAHNDLIESAITLGLPGLLIILAFIAWFGISMVKVWKTPRRDRDGYAMLGGALIAIMMLASLTDYLLRTPLLGGLFAVACGWLSMGNVAAKDARQARVVASRSQPDTVQVQDDFAL